MKTNILFLTVFMFVTLVNYISCGGDDPVKSENEDMVIDIDGNVYKIVKIGDQIWMAENLKVTHYLNGDPITNIVDDSTWSSLTSGAYCNYNNDSTYASVYGRMYNWYAVNDERNIAPKGWHVPTEEEWEQLEMFLGMSQAQIDSIGWRGYAEGGMLKESGTEHWVSPNHGASNLYGFTALPNGCRDTFNILCGEGCSAYFWSSSERNELYSHSRRLTFFSWSICRGSAAKNQGQAIRCIKNN